MSAENVESTARLNIQDPYSHFLVDERHFYRTTRIKQYNMYKTVINGVTIGTTKNVGLFSDLLDFSNKDATATLSRFIWHLLLRIAKGVPTEVQFLIVWFVFSKDGLDPDLEYYEEAPNATAGFPNARRCLLQRTIASDH